MMEHKGLLWVPVAFVLGAYLGHKYGDQVAKTCCKPAVGEKYNEEASLANQPVYIRETRTHGEGL